MGKPPDDPRTPPRTMAPAAPTSDLATVHLDEEAAVRPRVSPRRRAAQAGAVLAVLPVLTVAIVLILAAGGYYVRWGFPQA
jgi:hypothetical protein